MPPAARRSVSWRSTGTSSTFELVAPATAQPGITAATRSGRSAETAARIRGRLGEATRGCGRGRPAPTPSDRAGRASSRGLPLPAPAPQPPGRRAHARPGHLPGASHRCGDHRDVVGPLRDAQRRRPRTIRVRRAGGCPGGDTAWLGLPSGPHKHADATGVATRGPLVDQPACRRRRRRWAACRRGPWMVPDGPVAASAASPAMAARPASEAAAGCRGAVRIWSATRTRSR